MPRARRNRSAVTLQLPSPLDINLSAASPVEIRLQQPPKPPPPVNWTLRIFVITMLVIVIAAGWIRAAYVQPRINGKEQRYGDIGVSISHPQFVAYGDENEVEITVFNRGIAPVTGALVIAFTGETAPSFLQTEPGIVDLKNLPSGAGLTQKVKFGLLAPAAETDQIGVALSFGNWGLCHVSQMSVAGISYARTMTSWFFNPGVAVSIISTLFAFLWEVFKQRASGREA